MKPMLGNHLDFGFNAGSMRRRHLTLEASGFGVSEPQSKHRSCFCQQTDLGTASVNGVRKETSIHPMEGLYEFTKDC
jgi:hypothetical protein